MQTRREALKIIGAVGVTCAFPFSANELYGQHVHDHAAAQAAQPPATEPKFFNPAQLLVISRMTDLIIPPTDTPGAAAAGVPAYIDLVVNEDPSLQATFKEGLSRLDTIATSKSANSTFLQLTEPQQVEILTSLSQAAGKDGDFFHAIKNLTADGYYTSRIGLIQELGYNGDAVLTAFPESTIPEH
jgi:glucoside 3-dehydrogenase (cytochrome c) hitch-hiker subunit